MGLGWRRILGRLVVALVLKDFYRVGLKASMPFLCGTIE